MKALPAKAYRLFSRLEKNCRDRLGLEAGNTVIAAVSGGVDSVLLLAFFVWLSDRLPLRLVVAHLDHGLRPGAGAEARFVASLAETRGLAFRTAAADVAQMARACGGIEAAGRKARHDFFASLLDEYGDDALLALAHHENDQAETVLLNLGRGAGLSGAAAMQPREGHTIRPLLETSRQEIVDAAAELELEFVVDETNESDAFLRNRLRRRVLPLWSEAAGFDVVPNLARFAENLREDKAALNGWADEAYAAVKLPDGALALAGLRALPPSIRRRVLNLAAARFDLSLSRRHIEALFRLIENARPGSADLPRGVRAETDGVRLWFSAGG